MNGLEKCSVDVKRYTVAVVRAENHYFMYWVGGCSDYQNKLRLGKFSPEIQS